jgi:hypothetical protein
MYRSIFRTELELRSVQELVKQQIKDQEEGGVYISTTEHFHSQPLPPQAQVPASFDRGGRFVDTRFKYDDGYSSVDELSEISTAAAGIHI